MYQEPLPTPLPLSLLLAGEALILRQSCATERRDQLPRPRRQGGKEEGLNGRKGRSMEDEERVERKERKNKGGKKRGKEN